MSDNTISEPDVAALGVLSILPATQWPNRSFTDLYFTPYMKVHSADPHLRELEGSTGTRRLLEHAQPSN